MNPLPNRLSKTIHALVPIIACLSACLSACLCVSPAWAVPARALNPDTKFVADSQKTNTYRTSGVFDGGDAAYKEIEVSRIQFAGNISTAGKKRGFERMVLEVDGRTEGQTLATKEPPYFHVSLEPEMHQVVVTVFGKTDLSFDRGKITKEFGKSTVIGSVELPQPVLHDRWSMVLHLKKKTRVEVFKLTHPSRIIVDLEAR